MIGNRRELALALDVVSRDELLQWVETFRDLPLVLKVGLRLLPKLKESDFEDIKKSGFKIFVDAKLHDIPSQVSGAVKTWASLGADYLTLHLSGGPAMLREAATVADATSTELLAVSVLTSLSASDLATLGLESDPARVVERWVRMGISSGIRSFVCSVGESSLIHALAKKDFPQLNIHTVCPGIRLPHQAAASDQSRVFTVDEALSAGVNMLVVGRAIFQDSNPRARAEEILERIR